MLSTRLTAPTVAGALVLALGLAACGSAERQGPATPRARSRSGSSCPSPGPFSPLGIGDKAAIEQEVKRINADGGVLGRDLEVTIKDDKTDVPQSVTEYNQLAADRELHRDPLLLVRLGLDRDRPQRGEQQDPDHRPRSGERLQGRLRTTTRSPCVAIPEVYAEAMVDYVVDQGYRVPRDRLHGRGPLRRGRQRGDRRGRRSGGHRRGARRVVRRRGDRLQPR